LKFRYKLVERNFTQNKPKKSNTPIVCQKTFQVFGSKLLTFRTKEVKNIIFKILQPSNNASFLDYLTKT